MQDPFTSLAFKTNEEDKIPVITIDIGLQVLSSDMSFSADRIVVSIEYENCSDKTSGRYILFFFGFTRLCEHILAIMAYLENINIHRNRPDFELPYM
jgi:hypothetical protein